MSRLRVSVDIAAPPQAVWACVRDISTHVQWMGDAEAIRFTSPQREGVGTTFDCDTRLGPFRLTDRMEITDWVDEQVMGVRHVGLVTGTGRFTLRALSAGQRTRFTWDEELRFPLWMGGAVGSLAAKPIMTLVWRRSLRRLAELVELVEQGIGPR